VLLILGPAAVLASASVIYLSGGRYVGTDNAYVKAERVSVSADIAGRVVSVAVRENQRVEAGQELFRLDEEPLRIAYRRAEAQLESVRFDVEAMRASYRQKREELRLAEVNAGFADREFRRQSELVERRVAPEARFDEYRTRLDVARQQIVALRQDLARLLAALAGDADIAVNRHPKYLEAVAEVEQAALDLSRAVVSAPSAGIVSKIDHLRPGDYVKAGTPVFSVVSSDRVWIEANLKETDLTHVRSGQAVTVTVDAFPSVNWSGSVDSVGAATGAEFSILPAQNATGNWVKVVQRVPVRIALSDVAGKPQLRAGLSVVVDIDTGHRRSLPDPIRGALARIGIGE
jgi:membrane fusion protein (multidrug efflux system)